jgi:hypothetical protein
VIGRAPFHYEDTTYQYGLDESKFSFLVISNSLRISLGNTTKPLIVKYVSTTMFPGTATPIIISRFIIDYVSHIGYQIPLYITPNLPEATHVDSNGVLYAGSTLLSSNFAGGSLTPSATYKIYTVMVIDGVMRLPVRVDAITLGGLDTQILATPFIGEAGLAQRITSIELYIGNNTTAQGDTTGFFLAKTLLMTDTGWTPNNTIHGMEKQVAITTYDPVQNSLFFNLGARPDLIETRAKFNIQFYLLGRVFIGGLPEGGSTLRYSNIRGIVEEVDIFAYDPSGYGFILVESGVGEVIKSLSRTIENDLLIGKSRSNHVYQVQSGGVAKRLRQLFSGVGTNSQRAVVISDVGNFWYDYNDIYWYQGGYTNPVRIAQGKIRNWWKRLNQSDIDNAFSFFNRVTNEYWIAINDGVSLVTLAESMDTWRSGIEKSAISGSTYIPFSSSLLESYSLFINCYKIVDGEVVKLGYEAPKILQVSTGFTINVDESALIDYVAVPIIDAILSTSNVKILRFSSEFNNWDVWQSSYNPLWFSDKINGELEILSASTLYKFGGTEAQIAPFAQTHKVRLSDKSSSEQLEEVFLDHDSIANIRMAVTIDNESTPRTGNSPVFLASKKRRRASMRSGSSVNYITIKLSSLSTDDSLIREFGSYYQSRIDHVATRK